MVSQQGVDRGTAPGKRHVNKVETAVAPELFKSDLMRRTRTCARKGQLTETKLDEMRRRIKVTLLLKRLEDHVLSGAEMQSSQIKAAETLLRKAMPDLSAMTLSGDADNPIKHSVKVTFG